MNLGETKIIPYGRQNISNEDIEAVVEVLRSDYVTQGPVVPAFEKKVASHVGVKYGTAVTNATAALHMSCLALGVDKGDLVWTVPNSFVASASCALFCGAEIDFVDIDINTYNISIDSLEQKLREARKKDKVPKAA